MRRPIAIAVFALALLVPLGLVACGGGQEVSPAPQTVEGTLPAATTQADTGGGGGGGGTVTTKGDAAAGEAVFASAGCGGCHTLKAAGSNGNVGPNLDDAKPSFELAYDRVTNGKGVMPSFKDQLQAQQIADVAAYVAENAGK